MLPCPKALLLSGLLLLSACASSSTAPTLPFHGTINSLGMKFVPVPVARGQAIDACIHETRECDMAAFRGSASTSQIAATHVNWHEAKEFCQWLTKKEHEAGALPLNKVYRLPTDHEWSCMAGIGEREDARATPESKRQQIPGVYPWGTTWPPPNRAGNYFGREAIASFPESTPLKGYRDGQVKACAVMQFTPNKLGLYDLGGNVWEWCEDVFRPGTDWQVLRGAAWNCSREDVLLSSHRTFDPPHYRSDTVGFRVVRAGVN